MEDNEITEQSDKLLDDLEKQFEELAEVIEQYAIAKDGAGIKDLDNKYKALKETSKELNKLSKKYRKSLVKKDTFEA